MRQQKGQMDSGQPDKLGVKSKENPHIRTLGFCKSDILERAWVIVRRGRKEEGKHLADIYALEKLSERGVEEK